MDRILKESGGFEKAQEIRAQLEKMKAEGAWTAWKKYFSDKKSDDLPPEVEQLSGL